MSNSRYNNQQLDNFARALFGGPIENPMATQMNLNPRNEHTFGGMTRGEWAGYMQNPQYLQNVMEQGVGGLSGLANHAPNILEGLINAMRGGLGHLANPEMGNVGKFIEHPEFRPLQESNVIEQPNKISKSINESKYIDPISPESEEAVNKFRQAVKKLNPDKMRQQESLNRKNEIYSSLFDRYLKSKKIKFLIDRYQNHLNEEIINSRLNQNGSLGREISDRMISSHKHRITHLNWLLQQLTKGREQ